MLKLDCRLHLTTESRFIITTIVFLLIFCLFGLAPIAATDGWAKDITLEWDANTEPDLGGYIVHYGTESGIYDHSMDVGNFTSAVISGLDPDTEYYFAVSAYNLDGLSSALSNEVTTALTPSSVYRTGSGGGGGGGCFINTIEKSSPKQNVNSLMKALRYWWQKVDQAANQTGTLLRETA